MLGDSDLKLGYYRYTEYPASNGRGVNKEVGGVYSVSNQDPRLAVSSPQTFLRPVSVGESINRMNAEKNRVENERRVIQERAEAELRGYVEGANRNEAVRLVLGIDFDEFIDRMVKFADKVCEECRVLVSLIENEKGNEDYFLNLCSIASSFRLEMFKSSLKAILNGSFYADDKYDMLVEDFESRVLPIYLVALKAGLGWYFLKDLIKAYFPNIDDADYRAIEFNSDRFLWLPGLKNS